MTTEGPSTVGGFSRWRGVRLPSRNGDEPERYEGPATDYDGGDGFDSLEDALEAADISSHNIG